MLKKNETKSLNQLCFEKKKMFLIRERQTEGEVTIKKPW